MVSWLNGDLNQTLIRSNCREKPVYPHVPTFVSPQCQQLNWTFGGREALSLIIHWHLWDIEIYGVLHLPVMNRGAKTLGVRTRFLLARHQFNPSWQQRTVWRDTATQNIAQLLLSLSLGLDLSSMTKKWPQIPHYDIHASSKGQTSSFYRHWG